jgi:DNA-binding transcriptional LysR family regulator
MDPTALEILIDVIRTGSFSAAARERHLTTSTVSRIIASLETKLDTRLLQRSTRRLKPTDAALLLIEKVEPHLAGLRRAQEELIGIADKASGTLRITASTSFGIHRLSPLLTEFSRLHPALTLELHLTDAIVDLVAQRYDVALRHGALKDSSLVAQRLLKPRYFLCASPSYLRAQGKLRDIDDIAKHRCLVFSQSKANPTWLFKRRRGPVERVKIKAAISVNSGLALRQCVLDGAGIALLSDWLIGDDLASGRLVDLFPTIAVSPTSFQSAICAVYPSRQQVPRKVTAFIEFLRKRLNPPSAR